MKRGTAILLFSRSADAEAKHKLLAKDARRNQRLIAGLIAKTQRTLQSTSLPLFLHSEAQQSGATFGERIARSVASVFAQGFEQLIIVGNDCPQLTKRDLLRADRMLCNGRSVLGRDKRGGAYLIGLHRDQFSQQTFEELPWQQAGLIPALTEYLGEEVESNQLAADAGLHLRSSQLQLLRSLHDFNSWLDLRVRWCLFLRALLRTLRNMPAAKPKRFRSLPGTILPALYLNRALARRGPPVLV